MRVVVAIDSFKGSMSSIEAGEAAKSGILRTGNHDVSVLPLADGGEGTTEALVNGLGGEIVKVSVTGPFFDKVNAHYGILADGNTAVIEMAEAAGITLVDRNSLDPWHATTFGLGELIIDALDRGCRNFIIGIGGSATCDVGIGMLEALGVKILDKEGNELSTDFESLGQAFDIDVSHMDIRISECHFQIACDVKNPLCGDKGAISVFGPQKGVKDNEKELMDGMVSHFASVVNESFNSHYDTLEGAGASGGLGFAFKSFFKNVELRPGIDIVLDAIQLDSYLKEADVVITGEGRLDGQTAMGKVPVGVAKLAKKYGCKVIAFAGAVTQDARDVNDEGIDAFFPIIRGVCTLEDAMNRDNAIKNMEDSVEQVFRLLKEK
ncbi:MAG: glycerate kinase [Lachnospiraceae bacterium]|nr:glycerate kinase [Lachnospiraceae bacterium]